MSDEEELRQLLIRHFSGSAIAQLSNPHSIEDLDWHLWRRAAKFRSLYGRWLREKLGAAPRTILEVGCGTGSSTVVLAELGHRVEVTDLDGGAIEVAVLRCRQQGQAIAGTFTGALGEFAATNQLSRYDAIVFWASLEHMTITERLANLTLAWQGLAAGAQLLVLECPNRLWRYDAHTALQPFYHWLPDELIIATGMVGQATDQLSLYRIGRAASYHEFAAAGIPIGRACVIDSLQDWGRRRNILKRLKWLIVRDALFERGLKRLARHVHPAFFHEHLDLCLTKGRV